MQTAGAAPRANSAQKFTACDSKRFDRLRPSGRSNFTADVAMASPSNATNKIGSGRCKFATATATHATPAATTTATYTRAAIGKLRGVGAYAAAFIARPLRRGRVSGRQAATCVRGNRPPAARRKGTAY